MGTTNNGSQLVPWSRSEAWARAWSEMEGILCLAISEWRAYPGAVQIAPISAGPLCIYCRIEAFAEPIAGHNYPAVKWIAYMPQGDRLNISRGQAVAMLADQILRGHAVVRV